MHNFKITEKNPVKFSVKKGERYSFCTCGQSEKMPLCDGAHREKAPEYRSYKFEAHKDQTIWLCECIDSEDKRLIKPTKNNSVIMKKIDPACLVPMDMFVNNEPISIDLVYTQQDHTRNIFNEAIYHKNARLWTEYDMSRIIILAARKLYKIYGGTLSLKDCLRTYDAQEAMQHTQIVKDHPEWMEGEFRLLSAPGHGAHPRGMAIDVCVIDKDGNEIDMGTEFDEMTEQSARDYTGFTDKILQNRKTLENAFVESANEIGRELLPLPSEWWDFRFPSNHYAKYEPLSDADLPSQMRMVSTDGSEIPNFSDEHFLKLKNDILTSLN